VQSTRPASPTETQYDPDLFERLRTWRLETAQQAGQKAFYVFPDATLQRIAAARPQTLEDLQSVKGVGPKKLEQYGQSVLDITREEAEPPRQEQEA
jgi:superfamily II DNA helicase RecQ